MTTTPFILSADRVGYRVKDRWLVRDVSFSLHRGEVLVIMGPNGAGKTTLLKLMAGDLRPAEGRIQLNGRPVQDWPCRDLALQRAVLPQESRLAFPFTAWEVVAMGCLEPRQVSNMRRLVRDAMDAMKIEALASRDYLTLSGGEKQRVHLARALVQLESDVSDRPRCLLLDEPVSSLDFAHQHRVLGLARELARDRGIGVVSILHDLTLAGLYADRVVLLDGGRVAAAGVARDVLTPERVNGVYGLASIALADARLRAPLLVPCPAEAFVM